MQRFIIERNIPGASTLTPDELADIAAKSNAVVAGLDTPYRWITSYVAGDKVYCVHEAPDADVVRRHAREGAFPADAVVEVAATIGPGNRGDGPMSGRRVRRWAVAPAAVCVRGYGGGQRGRTSERARKRSESRFTANTSSPTT